METRGSPGKVSGVREYPGAEYGPVKKYDIVFDDGDTESNVDELWVAKKAEYELCLEKPEEDWIGVKNVRFPNARDNYARLIGWYLSTGRSRCLLICQVSGSSLWLE